jgi:hypothetical protein
MFHSLRSRNIRQPLTLDQILTGATALSAFAVARHSAMSARYAHIPTVNVIEGTRRNGFRPFAASPFPARAEDRREHTKHSIRFRRGDTTVTFRRTSTRAVRGIASDVRLNRARWQLMERFA